MRPVKPKGKLSFIREFVNPKPEVAFEWLKTSIRKADLGPGGSVLVFDTVPKNVETWLKKDAKRRGYRLNFAGSSYRLHITTKAQYEAAAKAAREAAEAREDYYNSPG